MPGQRVSGLAGRYHHHRIIWCCEIGDDPQPRAKALHIGLGVVTDRARAAVERVVPARGWYRDLKPIAQYRNPAQDRIGERSYMRLAPSPLAHVGAIGLTQ